MRTLYMVFVISIVALVSFTFVLGYYYDQALGSADSLIALLERQQGQLWELQEIVKRQKLTLELYKELLEQRITIEGHIIEEPTY